MMKASHSKGESNGQMGFASHMRSVAKDRRTSRWITVEQQQAATGKSGYVRECAGGEYALRGRLAGYGGPELWRDCKSLGDRSSNAWGKTTTTHAMADSE